jgi:hypothetical protein
VTAYRVTIGIFRAFRALMLTVSGIVERLTEGYVAGPSCLISGRIAGWHHDRVRTGRAERLALITIPVPWSSKRCQDDRATAQEEQSHEYPLRAAAHLHPG